MFGGAKGAQCSARLTREESLLCLIGHISCAYVLYCCRDCERLVRSKLLARKLGYHPSHKQGDSSNGSSGRGSESMIEEMMLTAVMTAPEGLSSWQHRAAVEALIDQQLDLLVRHTGTTTHTLCMLKCLHTSADTLCALLFAVLGLCLLLGSLLACFVQSHRCMQHQHSMQSCFLASECLIVS